MWVVGIVVANGSVAGAFGKGSVVRFVSGVGKIKGNTHKNGNGKERKLHCLVSIGTKGIRYGVSRACKKDVVTIASVANGFYWSNFARENLGSQRNTDGPSMGYEHRQI